MMAILRTLRARLVALGKDQRGTMVIETAIIAPVMLLMSLGTYEVSRMVARQHDLQAGVSEAEAIALAANVGAETSTTTLKSILMDSLKLPQNKVTVVKRYRCGRDAALVTDDDDCSDHDDVSTYLHITLTDTYVPGWRRLGVPGSINYSVVRTVQLS